MMITMMIITMMMITMMITIDDDHDDDHNDDQNDDHNDDDHNIGGWWPWWVMEAAAALVSPSAPASQPKKVHTCRVCLINRDFASFFPC